MTSPRATSWLAWLLWGVAMAFGMAFVVLGLWESFDSPSPLEDPDHFAEFLWFGVLVPAAIPAFATVGAVVASRRPGNWVG